MNAFLANSIAKMNLCVRFADDVRLFYDYILFRGIMTQYANILANILTKVNRIRVH